MFELIDSKPQGATIKVIGVGGGGGNAVKHMIEREIDGVDFICANTDYQALKNIGARTVIQLGPNVTKGLGAGANPDVGRQAAIEDRERIAEILDGASMIFITAGMGGGTGTGAAPVVAQIAKDLGILTVAVVTKPFKFEGKKRMRQAEEGIKDLAQYVDSLITIPNDKLEAVMGGEVSLIEAFKLANDVLHGAVQGIADLIVRPGIINVDFQDVRTVMSVTGMAMMGSASAAGLDRAEKAARAAVSSPLLEDVDLHGARGILINISASESLSLGEFTIVGETIEEYAAENATIVIGTVLDPAMGDEIKVTVVATGLGGAIEEASVPVAKSTIPFVEPPIVTPTRTQNPRQDWTGYDKSPLTRGRGINPIVNNGVANVAETKKPELEFMDIPAFLRRQAD